MAIRYNKLATALYLHNTFKLGILYTIYNYEKYDLIYKNYDFEQSMNYKYLISIPHEQQSHQSHQSHQIKQLNEVWLYKCGILLEYFKEENKLYENLWLFAHKKNKAQVTNALLCDWVEHIGICNFIEKLGVD
jgi:hypothetical protein